MGCEVDIYVTLCEHTGASEYEYDGYECECECEGMGVSHIPGATARGGVRTRLEKSWRGVMGCDFVIAQ